MTTVKFFLYHLKQILSCCSYRHKGYWCCMHQGMFLYFVWFCQRNAHIYLHHFHVGMKASRFAILFYVKGNERCIITAPSLTLNKAHYFGTLSGLSHTQKKIAWRFELYLIFIVSGYTPALSCAPTPRIADCLAIILAHMPFSATPNHVTNKSSRYTTSTPAYGKINIPIILKLRFVFLLFL